MASKRFDPTNPGFLEWLEVEMAMRPKLTPERRRRVVNILAELHAR